MRKQKFVTVVISLLFVLFVCIPAMAEEEAELMVVEDAYPAEQGELEVWLSPEYYSYEDATETIVGLALEYGIIDGLLFELEFEAFKHIDIDEADVTESGTGDLEVELAYSFMEEDSDTHIAAGLEYVEPLGDFEKGLSEGFRVFEPFVALSHNLSNGGSLHATLSYGILSQTEDEDDGAEEAENEMGIALAYSHPVSDSMSVSVEAEMESNEWVADGEETEGMAGLGVAWEHESGFVVGGAALAGLTDESADWAVLLTVGKAFELGGH